MSPGEEPAIYLSKTAASLYALKVNAAIRSRSLSRNSQLRVDDQEKMRWNTSITVKSMEDCHAWNLGSREQIFTCMRAQVINIRRRSTLDQLTEHNHCFAPRSREKRRPRVAQPSTRDTPRSPVANLG